MEVHHRRGVEIRAADPVAVPIHHGRGKAFGSDRNPYRRSDHVHWNRYLLNLGAEIRKPLRGGFHALVDGSFGGRLHITFLDDADLHALDALAKRLGIFLHLGSLDAGIVTVVSGNHLEQQRIVRHVRGHRAGVVDEYLDRHDAGIGHESPGRLHAVGSTERRRHADRATLVAADRHVDFTECDDHAAARRRATSGVAHLVWVMNRTGRIGVAAAGKTEVLAVHLALDFRTGIEHARDDRGVEIRYVTFHGRRAIHHRHAGQHDVVLQRDGLALQLAAVGALHHGFAVPRIARVIFRWGLIAGSV